jgi:hypothetical protein
MEDLILKLVHMGSFKSDPKLLLQVSILLRVTDVYLDYVHLKTKEFH